MCLLTCPLSHLSHHPMDVCPHYNVKPPLVIPLANHNPPNGFKFMESGPHNQPHLLIVCGYFGTNPNHDPPP